MAIKSTYRIELGSNADVSDPTFTLLCGDALRMLSTLPSESIHCCVTSPPYFQLRDYDVEGQIGVEESPEEYIARLVAVFGEVRRVLQTGRNAVGQHW